MFCKSHCASHKEHHDLFTLIHSYLLNACYIQGPVTGAGLFVMNNTFVCVSDLVSETDWKMCINLRVERNFQIQPAIKRLNPLYNIPVRLF
jgi:hypothetical protein